MDQQMWNATVEFAHVVMGEAGSCGMIGLLAAAWVCSRNTQCYGYAEPNSDALFAAQWYMWYPGPTNGASYLFSYADLYRADVQRIIRGKPLRMYVRCGASGLYAY